jgi:hypothetical protein
MRLLPPGPVSMRSSIRSPPVSNSSARACVRARNHWLRPPSPGSHLSASICSSRRVGPRACHGPRCTQRAGQRCATLIALWEEAFADIDARLPAALGLARMVGELAWVLEECLLAASDARGGGAGYAEGRLRAGLADITKQADAAQHTQAELRQRLLDLRPVVARLPPGPARDRLVPECERLLAVVADLGLGCDLWTRRAQVVALAERVRVLSAHP